MPFDAFNIPSPHLFLFHPRPPYVFLPAARLLGSNLWQQLFSTEGVGWEVLVLQWHKPLGFARLSRGRPQRRSGIYYESVVYTYSAASE